MTIAPGLEAGATRRLREFLHRRGLLDRSAELSVSLIGGGRSNITYLIESDSWSWVLRRPPFGHVLNTAHDMSREFRVLSGLNRPASVVPVPRVVLLCSDEDVIGAPFYLMEHVQGEVLRSSDDALRLNREEQISVAHGLIDVLADLHLTDPRDLGLADFGRPTGFMRRQVSRWTRQLEASYSRSLDGIGALAEDLARGLPQQRYSSIVHGDYRLDNCVVRGSEIAAVLDWEMSTLGDPFSDLGLFEVYYSGLADIANPVVQAIGGLGDYPSFDELLERYVSRTGRDVGDLAWYRAFAWFKFAVILEGIHYRSSIGATAGTGFDGVEELVQPSIDRGRLALAHR